MRNSTYAGVPSAGRTKYGRIPSSSVYQSRAAWTSSAKKLTVVSPRSIGRFLPSVGGQLPPNLDDRGRRAGLPNGSGLPGSSALWALFSPLRTMRDIGESQAAQEAEDADRARSGSAFSHAQDREQDQNDRGDGENAVGDDNRDGE